MRNEDVFLFLNKLDVALVNCDQVILESLLTINAKFQTSLGVILERDLWIEYIVTKTFVYRDSYNKNIVIEPINNGYRVSYEWIVTEKTLNYYYNQIDLVYTNKQLKWDGINKLTSLKKENNDN